jgi:cytidine deaminase
MSERAIALDFLLAKARAAAESSYSPYSKFRVGAAVLASGRIFPGANIENASYGLTICAERTALFAAILAGADHIEAIAVSCIDAPDGSPTENLMPCGACRQVLAEFAEPETPVVIDGVGTIQLRDLLPRPFRLGGEAELDLSKVGS